MMLGEASQLECRADGFYPPPVTLAWTRDGQVIQPAARLDGERTADGFYRAAANLTYYPSRWDQNATFGCQVSHSGVDQELKFQLNITCECPPFFLIRDEAGAKRRLRLFSVRAVLERPVVVVVPRKSPDGLKRPYLNTGLGKDAPQSRTGFSRLSLNYLIDS